VRKQLKRDLVRKKKKKVGKSKIVRPRRKKPDEKRKGSKGAGLTKEEDSGRHRLQRRKSPRKGKVKKEAGSFNDKSGLKEKIRKRSDRADSKNKPIRTEPFRHRQQDGGKFQTIKKKGRDGISAEEDMGEFQNKKNKSRPIRTKY